MGVLLLDLEIVLPNLGFPSVGKFSLVIELGCVLDVRPTVAKTIRWIKTYPVMKPQNVVCTKLPNITKKLKKFYSNRWNLNA